jgi:V/A-type H+-transporting ATPase subunit I
VIVPMARVHIVGPRRLLGDVIRLLQRLGTLHLEPLPVELEDWIGGVPVRGDPAAQQRLEEAAARLEETLHALPLADPVPAGGAAMTLDPESGELAARLEALHAEIHALDEQRAALDEERAVLARYEKVLLTLAPLVADLDGSKQVQALGIILRRHETEGLALFEEEVARLTGGAYTLLLRDVDDEHTGGLLAVPASAAPAVSRLLFEKGVGELKLPERYANRSFAEGVRLLVARRGELAEEGARCEERRRALGRRWRGPIAGALREARDRLARLRAVSFCGGTRHAFLVAGWAPEVRLGALAAALAEAYGPRVALFHEPPARDDADRVPVVLENPRWLRPFELLLALQPLPRYGSIDPTPYLALFFPLAFGLILGDVGHGLLALAIAALAYRKRWGGDIGRRVAIIAMASAGSAIGFGILFGEFFGELGAPLGLHPILIDRRHAMLPLLGMVIALGALQITLGVVLGLVGALRRGHAREAAAKVVTLAVLVDVALIAGAARGVVVPRAALSGLLVALAPLLLASVFLEGLLAPLELVRTFGSMLSYSRLMAVGLAAVMLAEVANRLAVVVKPMAVGIALAVLLHTVNFALGLLSPAIQALRLQYVEFFDKFFVPGGRPYTPLSAA